MCIRDRDRKYSYEIKYKKKWQSTTTLFVPMGNSITTIPDNVSFESAYGSCVATYKMNGNQLVYSRTISIDALSIPTDGIEEWNAFIKQLIAVYNTTIEFK